jgi:hypothetical protein
MEKDTIFGFCCITVVLVLLITSIAWASSLSHTVKLAHESCGSTAVEEYKK